MESKLMVLYGLLTVSALIISIPLLGAIVGPAENVEEKEAVAISEEEAKEGNNQPLIEIGETEDINQEKEIIINGDDMTNENEAITGTVVTMQTTKGNITIELFDKDAPITVQNFLSLVEKNFYDGIIFHRVIDGFMIQGGCPDGTGMGSPGHHIDCEFISRIENNRRTLSMANAGPNTGGSQFFINLVDNNFLDGRHTVFGRVLEGMDVVDAIGAVETDEGDRPVSDVIIENIKRTTK